MSLVLVRVCPGSSEFLKLFPNLSVSFVKSEVKCIFSVKEIDIFAICRMAESVKMQFIGFEGLKF